MSYDRSDWHFDSAIEAGQPEEQAFTHIGLYLAWLIRHDLHDPAWFPRDHLEAVARGDMTGSDLADDIDGKLTAAAMTADGAAFSDARYAEYVRKYGAAFEDLPDYGVIDNAESYAKVEVLLDRMYAEWVAEGRPMPPPEEPIDPAKDHELLSQGIALVPPGMSQEEIDELLGGMPFAVEVMTPETMPPAPHVVPEIEALIPQDMTSPPMDVWSGRATQWGSSLLNRALKRLGVAPKNAIVASGMGGVGEETLTVMIYGVSGIDADRLATEFQSVIFRLPGSKWEKRSIAGRDVQWASGAEFTAAFWSRDGMVIHVAGQPEVVATAISRLP